MPDWLAEILARPMATIPETARALRIGRNQTYEAVNRGEIPAEEFNGRKKVPTAWIRRKLRLDEPEAA